MHTFRSACAALAMTLLLCACTPQQALIANLMPTSAALTLLGNLQAVGTDNRKRVVELDRAGRWDELAKLAEENLKKTRASHDWWLVKGYALGQGGDHRGAATAYGEAVRTEPDSAIAWNMLAQSHRAAGDPRRAVVVLERAMLAVRDVSTTPFLLGESYSDIGRHDEAVTAYRQALAVDQKFAAAWLGLSRAYTSLGREGDAREARRMLERLDPRLARELDTPRERTLR